MSPKDQKIYNMHDDDDDDDDSTNTSRSEDKISYD